jgi:hypothetical protein
MAAYATLDVVYHDDLDPIADAIDATWCWVATTAL